ncbi:hypothetical protein ACRRVB_00055 [Candidatus Cardinium hertigii]|uniref:hypothetical protein n=1 Tax=Candidatus Cardinium hertigii TaxID=247481 RepID=UPI003D7C81A6
MKIKYYTNYFIFIIPVSTVCFFIISCSKLGGKYRIDEYKVNTNVDMKDNTGYQITNGETFQKIPLDLENNLINAVKNRDYNQVKNLVNNDSFNYDSFIEICNKNELLHKIPEYYRYNLNEESIYIINIILNKMDSFLLNEKMSLLLQKNSSNETPLLVAMKMKNIHVLKNFLRFTHKYIGLDLNKHIDNQGDNICNMIFNATDHDKLGALIEELLYYQDLSIDCIHNNCLCKKTELILELNSSAEERLTFLPRSTIDKLNKFIDKQQNSEVVENTSLQNVLQICELNETISDSLNNSIGSSSVSSNDTFNSSEHPIQNKFILPNKRHVVHICVS